MTKLPIPIPQGFTVLVKPEQKISQGENIASSTNEETQDLVIHIAQDLGTSPKDSEKLLTKKPGERIEVGDLIAKKGGIMGSREIRSKVAGTIVNFNSEDGTISVRSDGEVSEENKKVITSPVDGEVELCDNDKVVLKTDKEAVLAENASGTNSFGEVFYFDKGDLEASDINSDVSGKILIAKSLSREAISKAIGLSSLGILGINIPDSTFEDLKSKRINTPVLKLSEENFRKIAKKNEKLMLDSGNLIIIKL